LPTYEYRCRRCGHQFELFHGIKERVRPRCPKCRGLTVRVPAGGVGLLFRGSGFHITDYRSKAYREKAREEKSGGGGSASGKPPSGG
jgi:putative FmdB family regulatory protein